MGVGKGDFPFDPYQNRLVPTITLVDGVLPTVPDEARNKHQYPAMSGFV
ncbi:hypothetical protein [Limnospira sp. PMC 1261.20]|nr:hypothetical protein [Limnospira sp. PMC 1261.20]MDT9242126.1 hypothetical protein [Limnospira sp. PMC 1261.20]